MGHHNQSANQSQNPVVANDPIVPTHTVDKNGNNVSSGDLVITGKNTGNIVVNSSNGYVDGNDETDDDENDVQVSNKRKTRRQRK